ncbi:Fimbrial protein [Pseudidiomarina piscicola]|uniref:Fimbrial protein n=1 Tax=Pseudidiomarina piscicola TaxID=2614830 RepID=A0A6S6WN65_9GAMM|nr:prepilin-type N-terminal cleavage/methylation domain-containing protein [Pseudidiomarina piscicola]CAB0150566.1 Fimbrial protein [Pseudidiomarina piscicola]VZT40064.1 Fimbrial protein [Pseudomonas aeruginosa]
MRHQKGFTLIELIIVIVVLGILAVTAAPQFINFSSDARESTIKGLEASMKSAVELSYAKAAVENKLSGEASITTADGSTVALMNGYPKAAAIAAAAGAGGDWTFEEKTTGVYTSGSEANGVYVGTLSSLTDASPTSTEIEATNCFITYTDNADDLGKPSPAATISGC